jgi:hypothetical protein
MLVKQLIAKYQTQTKELKDLQESLRADILNGEAISAGSAGLDGRQNQSQFLQNQNEAGASRNQFQGINRGITACHPQLRRQIKDIELLGGYRQKGSCQLFRRRQKDVELID